MRFLSVAERELRAAARQNGFYRLRWFTAAGSFVLLLWLGWELGFFRSKTVGPDVFQGFSVVLLLYCLFVGATGTADSISRERRDGTLGLLFLTNLNSAGIVAGKLCSNGLALTYSLVATFPIMALPVLVGGITMGEFWRTVLALLSALGFALAAGFAASSVCVRQFPAIALATGLVLALGPGLAATTEVMRRSGIPPATVELFAMFSPVHTLLSANDRVPVINRQQFWTSLAAVTALSWTWLGFAAWWMGRTWRDQPKTIRWWGRLHFGQHLRERNRAARVALRGRLLNVNPFYWLAGRQRISSPIFMMLMVVAVLITVKVTAPLFGRLITVGATGPVVGHLVAWLASGLAIHALVLYYAAMVAAQRLAEDKQTGALELVLSSPLSEQTISRGLWLAYGRRMLFPALVAVLVHCFFIWQVLVLMVIEPPGNLPPNVTPGQIFWSALFNQPLRGRMLDAEFGFILRGILFTLGALMANWVMLGWLGRWLGLRMKHAGFAPMAAVALALVPPTLLFSLICYVGDQLGLSRMPERQLLPLMLWGAVGIALGNCLIFSVWAAAQLRRDFRTTITSRYQPPTTGNWILRTRRILVRFAVASIALVLILGLLIVAFYSVQNWQSRRQWAVFQKQLKQRGESLDLSAALPGPVSAGQNFAQSSAFQKLLIRPSSDPSVDSLLRESIKLSAIDPSTGTGTSPTTPWMQQRFIDFEKHVAWIDRKYVVGSTKDRPTLAGFVAGGLQPLQKDLESVALAARLPLFQVRTNRTADVVHEVNRMELLVLEQLHFLFELRACALLALGRATEAGEDVLTGLRLAALARQSVDLKSSLRVQFMLGRSLQPIWEGLSKHQWNETQLAAMQRELAGCNLLADHTNAIRRTVLAHLEIWQDQEGRRRVDQAYLRRPDWNWQPDAWWFDNCRQLYLAGQNAIARVDFAGGRVQQDYIWSDLADLPLDNIATQLFQQAPWWGNNLSLVSYAQTSVKQAIIACALERHRLANGVYPQTLDQLQPTYLSQIPRDTSRGRPVLYERMDDNHYALRGAGANGTIDLKTTPSDDWIWTFSTPTNTPPVAAPLPR